MKKTLLLSILALLGMTQAAAQEYEYVPFVREGVKWVCDAPIWSGCKCGTTIILWNSLEIPSLTERPIKRCISIAVMPSMK